MIQYIEAHAQQGIVRTQRGRDLIKLLRVKQAPILLVALLLVAWPFSTMAGRQIIDSAGRQVEVPDRVERVMAAGPPASVLVTILAPEKLVGWNRKPLAEDLPYLPPAVRNLPEIGRLTGRGGTANLEIVLAAKPDLIVDFGSVSNTYASLADRVQSETGIPYILIDGRFANTAAATRSVGGILGVDGRAEELARRIEEILRDVDRAAASLPPEARPRVYLARGPRGLETGNRGSINTEIIERAGAINVVDGGSQQGGLYNVSLEQVAVWNPDTVVTVEPSVAEYIRSDPSWSQIEAVRRDRVFVSPRLPYGWVDAPPSLNRLVGLQWLARLFIPGRFSDDVRDVARRFYREFYQVQLSEAELDRLLESGRKLR
jgi:iron complex transport system substrate-binding protein